MLLYREGMDGIFVLSLSDTHEGSNIQKTERNQILRKTKVQQIQFKTNSCISQSGNVYIQRSTKPIAG